MMMRGTRPWAAVALALCLCVATPCLARAAKPTSQQAESQNAETQETVLTAEGPMDAVRDIAPADFAASLEKLDSHVLVEFYAPKCAWSKKFVDGMARLAAIMWQQTDKVILAKVDLTLDGGKELRQKYKVWGTPGVILFTKGDLDNPKTLPPPPMWRLIWKYSRARAMSHILDHVFQHTGVSLKDEVDEDRQWKTSEERALEEKLLKEAEAARKEELKAKKEAEMKVRDEVARAKAAADREAKAAKEAAQKDARAKAEAAKKKAQDLEKENAAKKAAQEEKPKQAAGEPQKPADAAGKKDAPIKGAPGKDGSDGKDKDKDKDKDGKDKGALDVEELLREIEKEESFPEAKHAKEVVKPGAGKKEEKKGGKKDDEEVIVTRPMKMTKLKEKKPDPAAAAAAPASEKKDEKKDEKKEGKKDKKDEKKEGKKEDKKDEKPGAPAKADAKAAPADSQQAGVVPVPSSEGDGAEKSEGDKKEKKKRRRKKKGST